MAVELVIPSWAYPLLIWELIWKGIAMWKAGRKNQLSWYVVILILNSVGILPIVYLIWFQKDMNSRTSRDFRKRKKRKSLE